MKSGLENWNKYQSKISTETPNQYLDYLIDPSFQRSNRLLVLSFENEEQRKRYKRYYLLTVEIKYFNVIIDGKNFFDQPVRHKLMIFDNIRIIATGQGDYYTAGCLLDYNYFKSYYEMITIYLNKQQALGADPKVIQQINFTGNLAMQAAISFIFEEVKETVLDFSQGTVKVF